ncbi:MAG TPA: YfhO family protein [Bacteroidia bacterium]
MNLKSFVPHLIAIGIFLLVTVLYFNPVLFGGKEVSQSDILNFKGVSKEIVDYRAKTGKEALWTNALFSGMPAYQISTQYISTNLRYINNLFSLGLPGPVRMMFLYFLGFYLLMFVLKVDPWIGIIGALAFGFSSYFLIILDVGHNSKAMAIAYMAPVLAGFILVFRGKLIAGTALTALFLTMEINCNHPQISYYLGLLLMIYGITEFIAAIRTKKLVDFAKQVAALGIAGLIALGVNITSLWATADYSKYTIRGASEININPDGTPNKNDMTSGLDKSYATAWSYGVGESMTLLIPNFKGGSSEPIGKDKSALKDVQPDMQQSVGQMYKYFGDQPFTSGPVYAGSIIIFLFVLGLLMPMQNKGLKWTLIAGTIFSIWLSWGKNDPFGLSNFMLDHFPAYNKFRAVSMILVIAELTIPLLAVLALNELSKSFNLKESVTLAFKYVSTKQRIFFIAFALTGGIALLCWLVPSMFTSFSSNGEYDELFSQFKRANSTTDDTQIKNYLDQVMPFVQKARENIFKADALRSFIFILLCAGLLWAYFKKWINFKIAVASVALLVLIDLWTIDRRYLNNDSFVDKKKNNSENPFALYGRPNTADLEILKDNDPNFRVWNTLTRLDMDGTTSYFHKSLGGYHGAKLRRYQDLIDFHLNRRNMSVVNMLNTKYIIIQGQGQGQDNQVMAYPNREALGNAWFVGEYKMVANPDSEILALNHFDPSKTAIVDKRFDDQLKNFSPKKDSAGSIKLTSYQPNDLVYESNASSEQLAVFSEIYYPSGWDAFIDDKPVSHFRVNYVLRAARVPAGKHKVEFKFEPKIISTGEKISAASMLFLLLLCGGAAFTEFKKKSAAVQE